VCSLSCRDIASDEELECAKLTSRMQRKSGQDLSPEMWIMKLLLGPIDSSYDSKGASKGLG